VSPTQRLLCHAWEKPSVTVSLFWITANFTKDNSFKKCSQQWSSPKTKVCHFSSHKFTFLTLSPPLDFFNVSWISGQVITMHMLCGQKTDQLTMTCFSKLLHVNCKNHTKLSYHYHLTFWVNSSALRLHYTSSMCLFRWGELQKNIFNTANTAWTRLQTFWNSFSSSALTDSITDSDRRHMSLNTWNMSGDWSASTRIHVAIRSTSSSVIGYRQQQKRYYFQFLCNWRPSFLGGGLA